MRKRLAWWLSWLERRPVTAEVVGSNPIRVVYPQGYILISEYGILAQLGEHLPYKQRVIGSSPIGPIFMFEMKENVFMRMHRGVFLCFGIICIYGTLTKNERIAMME